MPVLLIQIHGRKIAGSNGDAGRNAPRLHRGDDAGHLLRRECERFHRGDGLGGHGDGGQRGGRFRGRILGADSKAKSQKDKDGVFHKLS